MWSRCSACLWFEQKQVSWSYHYSRLPAVNLTLSPYGNIFTCRCYFAITHLIPLKKKKRLLNVGQFNIFFILFLGFSLFSVCFTYKQIKCVHIFSLILHFYFYNSKYRKTQMQLDFLLCFVCFFSVTLLPLKRHQHVNIPDEAKMPGTLY